MASLQVAQLKGRQVPDKIYCSAEKCGQEPWGTAQFCILHDPNPDKDATLFEDELANFVDKFASTPVNLSGVVFPSGVSRVPIYFRKKVDFHDATFLGDIDFRSAVFESEAIFFSTVFEGKADFSGATFHQSAYFCNAKFNGQAYFNNATFHATADFWEATFAGTAWFAIAKVLGSLRFLATRFDGTPLSLFFGIVNLEHPEAVSFEHVDLSRASLTGTDMSRVRLVGVDWGRSVQGKKGVHPLARLWDSIKPRQRLLLYDHRHLLERMKLQTDDQRSMKEQYDRLELLYRQLRINLEASKQEVEAGEFYIGEMEMRRLNPGGSLWGPRPLLDAYRWIAHYGESYWRPFFWYVTFGLLFALAYLFLGIQAFGRNIGYQPFVAGEAGPFIGDLLVTWFRGSLMTGFPLGQDFRPASGWTAVLQFFNLVTNIVLIAMTILALRRHFKR